MVIIYNHNAQVNKWGCSADWIAEVIWRISYTAPPRIMITRRWISSMRHYCCVSDGELAQMVERSLSMREVPGSMPGFSKENFLFLWSEYDFYFWKLTYLFHFFIIKLDKHSRILSAFKNKIFLLSSDFAFKRKSIILKCKKNIEFLF